MMNRSISAAAFSEGACSRFEVLWTRLCNIEKKKIGWSRKLSTQRTKHALRAQRTPHGRKQVKIPINVSALHAVLEKSGLRDYARARVTVELVGSVCPEKISLYVRLRQSLIVATVYM